VAKGLSTRVVIGKHALKNALSPAVTIIGIQFGYLLGGTVIIEQIFSLPGIGQYVLQAIAEKDLPVIQGVVLITATAFVLINLIVDVLYGYLNPKIRLV
jgi:peptide/nickel transport system permease protein